MKDFYHKMKENATMEDGKNVFHSILSYAHFKGPQIWKMFGSKKLEGKMTSLERDAWLSFCNVVYGFLGKQSR